MNLSLTDVYRVIFFVYFAPLDLKTVSSGLEFAQTLEFEIDTLSK